MTKISRELFDRLLDQYLIKEFENPVRVQAAGGRKTRRRLLKRRRKTKRVRFAI